MFNFISSVKHLFVKPSARTFLSQFDMNTFTPPVLTTSVLFGMKDSFIASDTKPVLPELVFESYTIPADVLPQLVVNLPVFGPDYLWWVSFDEFSSAGDPALFLLRLDKDKVIRIVDSESLGDVSCDFENTVEYFAKFLAERYMVPVTV
jgi:hypothetical protein